MESSILTVWAIVSIIVWKQVDAQICDSEEDFLCPNGQKCISTKWICDNENDCGDSSDEMYCNPAPSVCFGEQFQCYNKHCYGKDIFCNGRNDCGDFSDEFYCNFPARPKPLIKCPSSWMRCNDNRRCVPLSWKCDGIRHCHDGSDEISCSMLNSSKKNPNVIPAKRKLIDWFLTRRKNDSSTNRWGHELHKIAIALYLGDESFFIPGNKIGEEMAYELTIQLLYKLSGNNTMRTQDLALYIQALLVTCTDPRDFFGHNLVSELRGRVQKANYTNPFEILVLCNSGDAMTENDVERVTKAFDSQHRPFWTDTQAIATMALECISLRSGIKVDERTLKDMQHDLKKRQFRNGTVDNPITTALVIQALLNNGTYKEYFDLDAAMAVVLENQKEDGSWASIQNSYYVLPLLNYKSFLNISTKHCKTALKTEEEVLAKLQEARGQKFLVQYSVWIGDDIDLARTWRVKVLGNNTFYDIIETVRRVDSRHNVIYNVVDDKPYVSSLYGKQDDSVLGKYWFTYVRSLSTQDYKFVEASPADLKVEPNQELVLWYKPGDWGRNSFEEDFKNN